MGRERGRVDQERLEEEISGEGPILALILRPVRQPEGPMGMASVGQPLFQEAGMACMREGSLVWAARLDGGSQIRALELREPRRLVVDVR